VINSSQLTIKVLYKLRFYDDMKIRSGSYFWFCKVVLHITLSKVCENSRKPAMQYLQASISLFILLIMLCIYFMVACLHWKLNWWLRINLYSFIIIKSVGSRNSLNNFDRTGSKLINLYDSVNFADLLGFWTIIIPATFHWNKKKPRLKTVLQIGWRILFLVLAVSIKLD